MRYWQPIQPNPTLSQRNQPTRWVAVKRIKKAAAGTLTASNQTHTRLLCNLKKTASRLYCSLSLSLLFFLQYIFPQVPQNKALFFWGGYSHHYTRK
jgi:hypothetical protein